MLFTGIHRASHGCIEMSVSMLTGWISRRYQFMWMKISETLKYSFTWWKFKYSDQRSWQKVIPLANYSSRLNINSAKSMNFSDTNSNRKTWVMFQYLHKCEYPDSRFGFRKKIHFIYWHVFIPRYFDVLSMFRIARRMWFGCYMGFIRPIASAGTGISFFYFFLRFSGAELSTPTGFPLTNWMIRDEINRKIR